MFFFIIIIIIIIIILLKTHITTYSALNLLTKRYNTYSADKYKKNTIF